MCGIAGFINKNCDYCNEITAMCDAMITRGPDGFGMWNDADTGLTLGHRRLSIIDLSENGKQPMESQSGRYIISFNGEIYNFKEIKKQLSEVKFRGTSDTEVLLESFNQFGIDKTLEMIRGMFAIALYDTEYRKLYLMRDRMGEKPLYYGHHKGDFVFASNLDAICAYKKSYSGRTDINSNALMEFLCYGYIPGTLSIYDGIMKVLPGQYVVIDVNNGEVVDKVQYWNIVDVAKSARRGNSRHELAQELEDILTQSVKEQMVADVPIGAYLSGGVDSSLIVATMRNIAGNNVKTYTIGIEGIGEDEAPWAKKVADCLGVKHTVQYISKDNMVKGVLNMGKVFSEPYADVSQVPTYMVSKLARNDVTVTLSGDAGDELFCGYNHYLEYSKIWNNMNNSHKYNKITELIASVGGIIPRNKYSDRLLDFKRKCEADSLEDLYRKICECPSCGDKLVKGVKLRSLINDDVPLQKYINSDLDSLDNLMLVDQLQYLPDDILVKVDSTGMGVSLENRIPLLDKRIIEFAWSVPNQYKTDGNISKMLMRDILYKYVPKQLIERPKQGFSYPASRWLISNKETREWADNLFDSYISDDGVLNKKIMKKLWKEYQDTQSGKHIIWNMVMLLAWAEERNIIL